MAKCSWVARATCPSREATRLPQWLRRGRKRIQALIANRAAVVRVRHSLSGCAAYYPHMECSNPTGTPPRWSASTQARQEKAGFSGNATKPFAAKDIGKGSALASLGSSGPCSEKPVAPCCGLLQVFAACCSLLQINRGKKIVFFALHLQRHPPIKKSGCALFLGRFRYRLTPALTRDSISPFQNCF